MIDVAEDIHPLTAFKRQTAKFARMLKRSRRPLVLTVEGKARFVVFDASAYEAWKDSLETVAAVNEALAEKGAGRPASEVHRELRQKRFGARTPATPEPSTKPTGGD
jgi:PHD/YefM family antitoxin component YafN of YafNO toxin-antitoxin module